MLRRSTILIPVVLLFLIAGCKEVPVEERDKKPFLRARELTEYGLKLADPEKYETFKKTYFYDGTYEIEYEFETPESAKDSVLYLAETISLENRDTDAKFSKSAEETGIALGLQMGGVKLEQNNDFYSYGDNSSFYLLKKDGRPVGNYFTTRVGKKTFSLIVSGFYIDDIEIWKELVEPKLKEFSSYNP